MKLSGLQRRRGLQRYGHQNRRHLKIRHGPRLSRDHRRAVR